MLSRVSLHPYMGQCHFVEFTKNTPPKNNAKKCQIVCRDSRDCRDRTTKYTIIASKKVYLYVGTVGIVGTEEIPYF